MTPNATGRHCASCEKTVIDFSIMTDQAIQQYIAQHHTESICGRVRKSQLHRIVIDLPHNVFQLKMPFWKRFLVAILLIFGTSLFPFETTIAGENPATSSYYSSSNSVNDKKPRILKKKKHRRRKEYLCTTMTISGGMGLYPDPPINSVLESPVVGNVDPSGQFGQKQHTDNISEANKSLPQKKEPSPAPPATTEFILPALLLKKRKNSNPTMD